MHFRLVPSYFQISWNDSFFCIFYSGKHLLRFAFVSEMWVNCILMHQHFCRLAEKLIARTSRASIHCKPERKNSSPTSQQFCIQHPSSTRAPRTDFVNLSGSPYLNIYTGQNNRWLSKIDLFFESAFSVSIFKINFFMNAKWQHKLFWLYSENFDRVYLGSDGLRQKSPRTRTKTRISEDGNFRRSNFDDQIQIFQ